MLKVTPKVLFLVKKCSSSNMLQDFYNCNRSWHITNFGRCWQNNCFDRSQVPDRNQSSNRGARNGNNFNGNTEFSIMSYNILSQDLLEQHIQLYYGCPRSALDWHSRRKRLARELKESNPDIICLQEVNSNHHAHFYKPFLNNLGYVGLYKKRTGLMYDGCALYYKTSKFTLLDHLEIEFRRRDITHLLDRDNVAIVAVLKPSQSSRNQSISSRLIVATTHLLFNPARGDIKLAQIRLLLAELDRLIKQLSPAEQNLCNVILCGDMNSQPNSPFYKFITEGYLNTSGYFSGDISGQGLKKGTPCRSYDLNLTGIDRSTQFVEIDKGIDTTNNDNNWRNSNKKSDKSCENGIKKYSREDFLKEEKNDKDEDKESSSISHNFKFSSVYPTHDNFNLPLVTTHHEKGSCMVDYIFYTKSSTLKLLGYQRLLNSNHADRIGFLPNNFLGSDHLSLHAKFLLKNKAKTNNH